MGRSVVIVTHMTRPHEVMLLVISLGLGAAYLLGSPTPSGVTALIPRWEILIWAACLTVSGAVGIAGIYGPRLGPARWRHRVDVALGLQLGAQMLGAGGLVVYTVAAAAVGGWRALFAATMTAGWAAANLIRAWQLRQDLKKLPGGEP